MVSRVTTDSDQLNNGLLMVFNQFFVGLLTIFVIIITMARLDWFMMLLVLVMTPLSMLVARFIAKKSYQLYRNQTKWRGMQTQLIEESLTQEALVQSLNAQDRWLGVLKTSMVSMLIIHRVLSFIRQRLTQLHVLSIV